MQYPESALPAVQLAIMAVVVTAVLAMWLILVFLAAREPRGKAGAVDREHRDEETAATVTGPTSGSRPGGRAAALSDMTPLTARAHRAQVMVTAQSRCAYAEDTMKLTVYGDFNCPYSYLASQRADQLIRGGMAQVDWRAVEHDRRLALTGTSSAAAAARGNESWLRSPRWHCPASTRQPRRRPWSATPAPRWRPTPRRSPTRSPMSCAAACSAPSGQRDGTSAAPTRSAAWSPG